MGSEEYEKQHQENEENVQKDKSKVRSLMCGKLAHYPNEYKNDKDSSGDEKHVTFAMITEVWILQGICPLKDKWVFCCSLKTRLADQTKNSTTEVVMVKWHKRLNNQPEIG